MNIVKKRTAELVPYKRNTKMHDRRQILNVAESIRQYGFVQPIVIDKNNVVVIGHCRLAAALELDMQEVPCVCVDDLTPKQVKALRIVDNKTNESPWYFDILGGELEEIDLSAFDFDFGFEDEEEQPKDREEVAYNENISVVIDCENEDEAERIFNKLSEEGYQCHKR